MDANSPRRRAVACERCRRRKQRCDRSIPSCSACTKAGVACKQGRKEMFMVQTGAGIAQPKGYIEQLEERIHCLKAMAQQRGLPVEAFSTQSHSSAPPAPTITVPPITAAGQQLPADVNLGQLSLTAMAEPRNRAGEFLHELSTPRLISALTETYGGNPESTARIDPLWDCIAKDIRRPLDLDAQQRLVVPGAEGCKYLDCYYAVVDFRYPRLDRAAVETGMRAITADDGGVYALTLTSDPAKVFMAYMVIAIVPLVSDGYPVAQASFVSIHILAKALRVLELVFRQEDGVDIIHSLLLLVVFSLHSSAAGSSWHLIGVAVKKCIALGFHREAGKPGGAGGGSDKELEERRLISTALDRPFGISDRFITAQFPGRTTIPLTPAESRQVHLFRYAVLMSDIVCDRGRRPFVHSLSQLLHWKSSAPMYPQPYPREQSDHLHSLYNTLLLRAIIDRTVFAEHLQEQPAETMTTEFLPLPPPLPQSPTAAGSPAATATMQMKLPATCHAVVASLTRSSMKNRSFLSWITGYSAFSAALGLLYSRAVGTQPAIYRQVVPSSASPPCTTLPALDLSELNLDIATQVLTTVARQFPIMERYRDVIVRLRGLVAATAATAQREDGHDDTVPPQVGPRHVRLLATRILVLAQAEAT